MLVSDYDQTYYLNDIDIEINKKSVEKFRTLGHLFVIATGRSYFDFKSKEDIYNFAYDYVIINHGATILNKDNMVIDNYYINDNIKNEMINDLDISDSINYFCCNLDSSRLDFNNNNLTKIHVRYKSKEKALQINTLINNKYNLYVNCYYVNNNSIEIISNKTDKAKAIISLAEKLNIQKEEIYTIGDGYSDIEMIKKFNVYCMKEAVDEVKKWAKKEYNSVSLLVEDILK